MKLIRIILGKIILTLDSVFSPASMKRSAEGQAKVDAETKSFVLYQLLACPFCVKVRRAAKRLGLTIATREIATDAGAHDELMAGGTQDQVPCLRITHLDGKVEWMYESSVIVEYLEKRFAV